MVPLDFPYSVFIDVCNACNFKCNFCAIQTADVELPFKKQVMGWELYKKVINDICEYGRPLKMLRLTANGEPLINKDLPRMIRFANEKNASEHIEIVTNASLLTHDLSRELIGAGLNRIRISIEAPTKDGYKQMCGVNIEWEKFIDNIEYFYKNRGQCEVYIKTVDAAVPNKEAEEEFYRIFEDKADRISVEHVIPIWTDYKKIYNDFDIEQEGLHGHELREVRICPFPFYSCVVNPDGEVTVCCNDWKRGIIVGNVGEESFLNIWNGERYRSFLTGMVKRGRLENHDTCATCEYPIYDAVDNLDDYTDQIMDRMMRKIK